MGFAMKVKHLKIEFRDSPRLQESQILQNSSEILANFAFLTRILQVCKRIAIFARLVHSTIFLARFLQKFCKICVLHTKILTKVAFLIFDYFDQKFVQIFFRSDFIPLSEILGFVAFARTGMQFLDLFSLTSYSLEKGNKI